MGTFALIDEVSAALRGHRGTDPTAPVTILVATADEARELRTSLARADDPRLHVGVVVDTPLMVASRGHEHASQWDLGDAVRRHAAEGYFGNLDGLTGVTEALLSAVRVWDVALPEVRRAVIERAPSPVDKARLRAIEGLHVAMAAELSARGLVLPSTVLAEPAPDEPDMLWIDATVTVLDPIAEQWVARLQTSLDAARFIRLDVAGDYDLPLVVPELTSVVDPVDECGLAARAVTAALEAGIAARDIAVAVPPTVLGRYSALLGGLLASAGSTTQEHESARPRQLADTRVGRALTALGAAAAELRGPRDLRFDHLTSVITAGGLPDAQGTYLNRRTLTKLWRAVRGSDPATWPSGLEPDLRRVDEADVPGVLAAAATATRIARALELARRATGTPQAWQDLGVALEPLVPSELTSGRADATARNQVLALLRAWSRRPDQCKWSQAFEEVAALLREEVQYEDAEVAVRIVPLSAAWATVPKLVVAIGLSDDLVPGLQKPVGPLAADEVMTLGAGAQGGSAVATNDARSLAAMRRVAAATQFSYPRSDQLRTIERTESRFLTAVRKREFGSVGAQFEAVDRGETGLLGRADAVASMLRTGAAPAAAASLTAGVDVAAAMVCVQARRQPPPAGAVDPFNGDLRALSSDDLALLSLDRRRSGGDWASPSALEKLLGCPIGWWASRIVGVGEPEAIDPAVLEQPRWGTWLHRALVVLSEHGLLLSDQLTDDDVSDSLWVALGGEPEAELDADQADEEVLGYRFRVTEADLARGVRDVRAIAGRLRVFLSDRPARVGHAIHEVDLDTATLQLPSGPLTLGGRVDRIDTFAGDHHLVTDYKTGRAGSGLQLAVYAWLWLLGYGGDAELLYATTRDVVYQPQELRDDGESVFTAESLAAYLQERLAHGVAAIRDGVLASGAWSAEHDRYCPICADLEAVRQPWGPGGPRGERALALATVQVPEDAATAMGQVTS
ncbi:MAG: PD-(D/E)XK nuclease family protein [Actinobacteria bacterium]|nr:PD-(D/E)XK nuclease family protein [Actinomycetota bacterium]MCB9412179.1 PD-(D/E)XK nuclease family protein [Actinomycetota bacterium]